MLNVDDMQHSMSSRSLSGKCPAVRCTECRHRLLDSHGRARTHNTNKHHLHLGRPRSCPAASISPAQIHKKISSPEYIKNERTCDKLLSLQYGCGLFAPQSECESDKAPSEPPRGTASHWTCGLSPLRGRRSVGRAPRFNGGPELARELLEQFTCPITHATLVDPVIAADGHMCVQIA